MTVTDKSWVPRIRLAVPAASAGPHAGGPLAAHSGAHAAPPAPPAPAVPSGIKRLPPRVVGPPQGEACDSRHSQHLHSPSCHAHFEQLHAALTCACPPPPFTGARLQKASSRPIFFQAPYEPVGEDTSATLPQPPEATSMSWDGRFSHAQPLP